MNQSSSVHESPTELVAFEGMALVSVDGTPIAEGSVTLTNLRLLFRPLPGVHEVPELEVPLSAVASAHLRGLRPRLRLEVGEHVVVLEGPMASRIHGSLSALLYGPPWDESREEPEELLTSFEASLFRGPVTHPGQLVLTSRRLHFAPSRALDAAVGAGPFDVPLERVTCLSISGWPERRLVVRATSSERRFAVHDAPGALQTIARRVQRCAPATSGPTSLGVASIDEAAPSIALWRPHLGFHAEEELVAVAPCLHWRSASMVERGWLVRTTMRMLFVPTDGPGDATGAVIQGGESILVDRGRLDGPDIYVRVMGHEHRFSPIGPDDPTLDPTRAPSAISVNSDKPAFSCANPVSLILGPTRYVRILQEGEILVSLRRNYVIDIGQGLGLALPGTPDSAFSVGSRLTVEVGRDEGVYSFDAHVDALEPAPEGLLGQNARQLMLVVGYPDDIRFYNRRDRFRVAMNLPIDAWPMAFGEDGETHRAATRIPLLLDDLSPDGCSILSQGFMRDGSWVVLDLDLDVDGEAAEVMGEVVRSESTSDPTHPWRHGVRFSSVQRAVQDRIYREIVRRQRDDLSLRADLRRE